METDFNYSPAQARAILERTAGTMAAAHGITVEIKEGARPMTNGKKIILPPPRFANADDWIRTRGYIDHETAHVIFSDMSVFEDKTISPKVKNALNMLEDVRVNELMRRRYPGSRDNLSGMYRTTMATLNESADKAAAAPEEVRKMGALHANLEGLESLGMKPGIFGADAHAFADSVAAEYLAGIQSATSTRDLLPLARRLVAEEEQQDGEGEGEGDGDEQQEGEGKEDGKGKGKGKKSKGDKGAGGGKDEQSEDETEDGDGESGPAGGKSGAGATSKGAGSPIADAVRETMKGAGTEQNNEVRAAGTLEDHRANDAARHTTAVIPWAKSSQGINARDSSGRGYPAAVYENALRMSAGVRDNLRQAIRAKTQARTQRDQETGALDLGKLATIAARVTDPAVFQRTSQGMAVDTALTVILDASSSMAGDNWKNASAAAGILCDAAAQCGAACRLLTLEEPTKSTEICGFDDTLTRAQWITRLRACLPHGGTPTGNVLAAAAAGLLKRPEPRKIVVILTDGEPNSKLYLAATMAAARVSGIEVYTIGMGMSDARHIDKAAVACPDTSTLRGVLLKLLTRCLIEKKGGR